MPHRPSSPDVGSDSDGGSERRSESFEFVLTMPVRMEVPRTEKEDNKGAVTEALATAGAPWKRKAPSAGAPSAGAPSADTAGAGAPSKRKSGIEGEGGAPCHKQPRSAKLAALAAAEKVAAAAAAAAQVAAAVAAAVVDLTGDDSGSDSDKGDDDGDDDDSDDGIMDGGVDDAGAGAGGGAGAGKQPEDDAEDCSRLAYGYLPVKHADSNAPKWKPCVVHRDPRTGLGPSCSLSVLRHDPPPGYVWAVHGPSHTYVTLPPSHLVPFMPADGSYPEAGQTFHVGDVVRKVPAGVTPRPSPGRAHVRVALWVGRCTMFCCILRAALRVSDMRALPSTVVVVLSAFTAEPSPTHGPRGPRAGPGSGPRC